MVSNATFVGHPTNSDAEFVCFRVLHQSSVCLLLSEDDDEFAVLDTQTASRLSAVSEIPMLRFEAVVRSDVFFKRQRRAKHTSRTFPLSINIFGSKAAADDAASRLSQASAYLQHPQSELKLGIVYHNPQFLPFPEEDWNMRQLIGTGNTSPRLPDRNISEVVGRILESLAHINIAANEELELHVGLTSQLKM